MYQGTRLYVMFIHLFACDLNFAFFTLLRSIVARRNIVIIDLFASSTSPECRLIKNGGLPCSGPLFH